MQLTAENVHVDQFGLSELRYAGVSPEIDINTEHIATMFNALAPDAVLSDLSVRLDASFAGYLPGTREGDIERVQAGGYCDEARMTIPVVDSYESEEVPDLDLPEGSKLFVARSPEHIQQLTLSGLQRIADLLDDEFRVHNEEQTKARREAQAEAMNVYHEWYSTGYIGSLIMFSQVLASQSVGGSVSMLAGMGGLAYAQRRFIARQEKQFERELTQMPADVSARLAAERSGEFEEAITFDRLPEHAEVQYGETRGGRVIAFVDPYAAAAA